MGYFNYHAKAKKLISEGSTVFLTYNGETKSASEWAEITGIRQGTIVRRKTSYGWSDEECLTIKVGEKRV